MPASYTDSDSDVTGEGHVQPSLLAANEDQGYKKDWVHTVENEITRGKILRTEKPSTSRQKREYDVVNISLSRPYCNKTHLRRKIDYSKKHKRNTNPCPFQSPIFTPNTDVKKKEICRTKIKQKKCPMRLAELAIPTKRQCIDTWRNKSYLLPERMIERLKQYVMDQRPVVQISDAINCFRRRKSVSSKKSKRQHCKCKTSNGPMRVLEAQTLCAIFGQKIAKSLKTPLNLSLGSKYEQITRVVAMDIANIMYGRKNARIAINQTIHDEMSNKVTIWILNILEDASYRLLLEDIKDLEEEEGPVLDFMDDLVANVVTSAQPCTIKYELSSESSCKDEYDVVKEPCGINTTLETKSDIHKLDGSGLTDAEYFNDEIYNIIINFNEITEDDQGNEDSNKINETLNGSGIDTKLNKEKNGVKPVGNLSESVNNIEAIQKQNDLELEGNPLEQINNNELIQKELDFELERDTTKYTMDNDSIQEPNNIQIGGNLIEHSNDNEAIEEPYDIEMGGNLIEHSNDNEVIEEPNDIQIGGNLIKNSNDNEAIEQPNDIQIGNNLTEHSNDNEAIEEPNDFQIGGNLIEHSNNNEAIEEPNDFQIGGNLIEHSNDNEAFEQPNDFQIEGNLIKHSNDNEAIKQPNDIQIGDNLIEHSNDNEAIEEPNDFQIGGNLIEHSNDNEAIEQPNDIQIGDNLIDHSNNSEAIEEPNDIQMGGNFIEKRNDNEAIEEHNDLELEGDRFKNEEIQEQNDDKMQGNSIEHSNNNKANQEQNEVEMEDNSIDQINNNEAPQEQNDVEMEGNSIENSNSQGANQEQNQVAMEGNPTEPSNNNDVIEKHSDLEVKDDPIEHRDNDEHIDLEFRENPIENINNSEAIQEQNDVEMENNPSEHDINISDDTTEAEHVSLADPDQNLDAVENEDVNKNNESNVSEVFEIFTEELTDDEKNKKVKFSLIDMVNQVQSKQLQTADTGREPSIDDLNHEQEQIPRKPNNKFKSDIAFSEPNLNLLSDADELWPSDLSSISLKASDSVSKSIISLGNIIETDEKNITPYENEEKLKIIHEMGHQADQIIPVGDEIRKYEDTISSHNGIFGETYEQNILMKQTDDLDISIEVEIKHIESPQTMIHTKLLETKIHERSKVIEHKTDMETEDGKDKYYKTIMTPIVDTEKVVKEEITVVHSTELKEDSTWKVHLDSVVPSWVIHSRGEPKKNPVSASTTIRDSDIRDWCKHLEDGFKNLELWTKWIDKIDQDINTFKYRTEICAKCSCPKRKHTKKYTELIKHVNTDTILWRNVFRSSHERCNGFRRLYHNHEIEVAPTACWYRCTCKNW